MTYNQPNQPLEPFRVQSDLLKSNRPTGPEQPPQNPVGRWADEAKWLAIPAFAAIYAVAQHRPEFQPVTMFVLLACVLFRMDNRRRQLAGVILTMSTIKLAAQMASHSVTVLGLSEPPQMRDAFLAVPWLPIFFAAGVFYLPKGASVTGKILTTGAMALLASGLLPSDGYVVIFAMIQYLLFIAVGVGLAVDYTTRTNGNGARGAVRTA